MFEHDVINAIEKVSDQIFVHVRYWLYIGVEATQALLSKFVKPVQAFATCQFKHYELKSFDPSLLVHFQLGRLDFLHPQAC